MRILWSINIAIIAKIVDLLLSLFSVITVEYTRIIYCRKQISINIFESLLFIKNILYLYYTLHIQYLIWYLLIYWRTFIFT